MLAIELAVDPRRTEALCGTGLDKSWTGNGYCEAGEEATEELKGSSDARAIGDDIVSKNRMVTVKANVALARS